MRRLQVLLVLVVLCPLCFGQGKSQPALTFVQITDAHVFDDSSNQSPTAGYHSLSEDWSALDWATRQVHDLVRAGEPIDFVVYTGDLGLRNVALDKDCEVAAIKAEAKGLPPIDGGWAAAKIAAELDGMGVKTVYFVPGNNDLYQEAVTDAPRAACFVKLVQSALSSLSPPSAVHFIALGASAAESLKGFRLAGLNSASFKDDANYGEACPKAGDGCPEVEIAALQKLASVQAEPILLFTHIPDLVDPFRKHPAWKISDALRAQWKAVACGGGIAAIFAGHFHDSDPSVYGPPAGRKDLTVPGSECVKDKTWVAPPLAIKNQGDHTPRARGLMLVRIFQDGAVHAEVRWY